MHAPSSSFAPAIPRGGAVTLPGRLFNAWRRAAMRGILISTPAILIALLVVISIAA
ncbi:MAG TPA: hypothetical protein VFE13_16830 [Caulobacteraceae bacterium]|nr:hypothetical protein [Caulobacteraceae bacterium]